MKEYMRLFFRLPSGLTMECDIDPYEIKSFKNYAEDLLCTRYDMSKIKYYLKWNDFILDDNELCDLKIKSYDTIYITFL